MLVTIMTAQWGRPLYFAAVVSIFFLWPPCVADADIIFLSGGFFFFLLSSIFLNSSPNLSRRRLDVYHTSTHGVALVRITDPGLKRAARGSLKYTTQKIAKNSQSGHHRTTLLGYIFANKARIDNQKNF